MRQSEEWTKIELAAHVWEDGETTRLLAEHYTGLLTLSRLELISLGLEALTLRWKKEDEFASGDIAYALMSLLHYRPFMNPHDNLFQALARLSLANDSDRIIERMTCMLPDPDPATQYHSAFVLDDVLGAKLWDIEPLCQVAGVGDGNEFFLDGCQGASIRWKDIPRISFHGRRTWKKRCANIALRTAPIWWIIGVIMLVIGAPKPQQSTGGYGSYFGNIYNGTSSSYSSSSSYGGDPTTLTTGSLIFLLGMGMIFGSCWTVQIMYGGKVWGTTPMLVGFEGALPLRKVERHVFGNAIGRLSYAPSSSNLCHDRGWRQPRERIGAGPTWLEGENPELPNADGRLRDGTQIVPEGQRLFTLIDTGPSMMLHVFTAARPPTAALVCGKEGGMLRVALCSYERATNCLHKETVLRMETPMLNLTTLYSWLKIA